MKMKIIVIILAILVVILGVLLIVVKSINKESKPKQLEIFYRINAGIPFRWEYEIEDPSIVEFVQSKVVKDENKGGIVGAPVTTKYIFKGLKEGKTTIIFKYVEFTENRVDHEEKYLVKVDKDKNIELVETKK